jgi:hypothetical protein
LQGVPSRAVIPLADVLHLIPDETFRVPFQLFTRKRPCNQIFSSWQLPFLSTTTFKLPWQEPSLLCVDPADLAKTARRSVIDQLAVEFFVFWVSN